MFELLILAMIGGIPEEQISYQMDIWVEPEFWGKYLIVKLIVVNYDIPEYSAYYSQLNGRIVVEEKALRPAYIASNGACISTLWHEILHAQWQKGSEGEDHVRMVKEDRCR